MSLPRLCEIIEPYTCEIFRLCSSIIHFYSFFVSGWHDGTNARTIREKENDEGPSCESRRQRSYSTDQVGYSCFPPSEWYCEIFHIREVVTPCAFSNIFTGFLKLSLKGPHFQLRVKLMTDMIPQCLSKLIVIAWIFVSHLYCYTFDTHLVSSPYRNQLIGNDKVLATFLGFNELLHTSCLEGDAEQILSTRKNEREIDRQADT